MAKTALVFFLNRSGGKPTSQIQALASTLKSIAKHRVNVEPDHLEALKALCRRLRHDRKGLTPKNRERLRLLDDPLNRALLITFPQRQLDEARRQAGGLRSTAVKVRSALAVEVLLMIPIRASNLAAISLERHLQWSRPSSKSSPRSFIAR